MLSHSVSAPGNVWAARAGAFVLWALLMGCAVYWGLKLFSRPPASVAVAPAARAAAQPEPMAVARLLGWSEQVAASAPAPSLASRFALLGVVAGTRRGGAALIAVDGKPARPYRVGNPVGDGAWLQAVEGRKAVLSTEANGPPAFTLELPPLAR